MAVAFLFAAVAFGAARRAAAQAQTFPPITNRDFRIDLFEQPAIGSPRLIAMSGAIDAVAAGAAGLYTNPASAAVRPETHSDKFAWNVYFNSYVPSAGQDPDNNGQSVSSTRRSLLGGAGVLLQYGKWALTLDAGLTEHEIAPEAGGGLGVRSVIPHLAVARTFLNDALAVGIGIRGGVLNVYTLQGGQSLFTRLGGTGELGVVWKPNEQSFRLAASGGGPVYTGALSYNCDPNNCYGYILPSDAIVPWDATVGGAWRFGRTAWNHNVDGDYQDERDLIVAVQLSVMGAVANGFGMEAFAAKQLQPSGQDTTYTPRLGLESEVIPGWLRLRAGTYYEPSRFPGVSARAHATGGVEGRLFGFHFMGHERRVSLAVAVDDAARYRNLALSIGFWN